MALNFIGQTLGCQIILRKQGWENMNSPLTIYNDMPLKMYGMVTNCKFYLFFNKLFICNNYNLTFINAYPHARKCVAICLINNDWFIIQI